MTFIGSPTPKISLGRVRRFNAHAGRDGSSAMAKLSREYSEARRLPPHRRPPVRAPFRQTPRKRRPSIQVHRPSRPMRNMDRRIIRWYGSRLAGQRSVAVPGITARQTPFLNGRFKLAMTCWSARLKLRRGCGPASATVSPPRSAVVDQPVQ